MEIELVPGGLWNIIGSIAIIAFGVAVAMAKPRARQQVWFLALAVSFGVGSGLSNINIPDPQWLHEVVWFGVFLGFAVAPISVAGLVLSYAGQPESPSSLSATMVPAAVILAFVAAAFIVDPGGPSTSAEAADIDASKWLNAGFAAFFLYHVSILASGLVLTLWARRGDEFRVRQAARLSSALVLYTAWVAGSYSLIPFPFMRIGVAGIFLGLMLLSAFWLSVAARESVFTRREERHLAEAAEHLGIGPKRALELREHVEAEAAMALRKVVECEAEPEAPALGRVA